MGLVLPAYIRNVNGTAIPILQSINQSYIHNLQRVAFLYTSPIW